MPTLAAIKVPAKILSILAISLTVYAGNAGAYQCKSYPTQATATHKLKLAAQSRSRTNWQTSVKNQFGLPWTVWSIAQAKTVNCSKQPGRWICLASAKPCKYVVP